jgi:hypothetical protein
MIMDTSKNRRSLRLALVLCAAVAGTALVGWGGLAAWQAYTQNSGNAFAVGTLSHTNAVGLGGPCASTLSSTSPGACSVIVSGAALTSDFTGASNTVTITNTGSLSSTFSMSMPAAPGNSELCQDLGLTVTDNEHSPVTVYPQTALSTQMGVTQLKNTAGASTWATGDANTFTFAIAPINGFASDDAVLNTSCSFTILFDQASA